MTGDPAPGASSAPGDAVLRISRLCSLPVIDEHGRHHGTVLDVRVVRDGPTNVSGDAAMRIDGLVVGPAGWTERMGLFRTTVHGPWLLSAIARRFGPDRAYLPWNQVASPRELGTASEVHHIGDLQPLPDDA